MPQIHAEYELVSINEWDRKNRNWQLSFCFLPHKCIETGKLLWLQYAYRGVRTRRFEDNIFWTNYKWMSKEEFIVLRLMDKV